MVWNFYFRCHYASGSVDRKINSVYSSFEQTDSCFMFIQSHKSFSSVSYTDDSYLFVSCLLRIWSLIFVVVLKNKQKNVPLHSGWWTKIWRVPSQRATRDFFLILRTLPSNTVPMTFCFWFAAKVDPRELTMQALKKGIIIFI